MKMNIGRVNSGYHFINFMMAENGMSDPPVPQSANDATAPTMPMPANTRCPVNSINIIEENIRIAIISDGIRVPPL
jgi:hypothetical protein